MEDSSLISVSGLSFVHGNKSILHDISLEIYPGQLVTLIGPNGSGKTTLLRIILGLIHPTAGLIRKKERLRIGYMPQRLFIDRMLPISVAGFLKLSPLRGHMREVLERVGMDKKESTLMQHLSGGEFQRVLLARALLQKPDLLVLDEPVQGVDIVGQAELHSLIREIRDESGCGVLLVSHDLHFVHNASDRVICLNHHICCQGRPEDIQEDPDYLSLFGIPKPLDGGIALYHHTHDHRHDAECGDKK